MKIVIVGGGIAGLSCAFELSKFNNLDIELYDMKSELGGLAKSSFDGLNQLISGAETQIVTTVRANTIHFTFISPSSHLHLTFI